MQLFVLVTGDILGTLDCFLTMSGRICQYLVNRHEVVISLRRRLGLLSLLRCSEEYCVYFW